MTFSVNVLNNLREFLQRVEVKGLESFAFVEVFTAVQNEIAIAQNPALAAAIAAQAKPVPEIPADVAGVPTAGPGPTVEDETIVSGPLDPQE